MLRSRTSRPLSLIVAASLLVLALTGCSAGAKATEVTIPKELTPPGTALAVGETVRIPGAAYKDGGLVDAEVATTVLSITQQDESFFDKLDNGDEFAGYSPYTVIVQDNLPDELLETHERPNPPAVWGVLDTGEYAEYLKMDGMKSTGEVCGDGSRASEDTWSLTCQIFLAPEGAKLDHVEWNGEQLSNNGVSDPFGESSPYLEAPITWK